MYSRNMNDPVKIRKAIPTILTLGGNTVEKANTTIWYINRSINDYDGMYRNK